ncbi:S1/P1 nuclease [Paraferrimonas sedimenticola]|uniref:Endonuclease n=1 Tax=Paraferrimonas sedimenticola TaxID=375674 RepID=A0AA37RUG9_9GAMM|nr:S1/P1 nuclease [Paraferrimonas sedimenticola]GLP95069.1 endonuclease [Paraferrimonas sedimenticola]
MKHLKIFILLGTLFFHANGFSWGQDGHRIVAEIAESQLNDKARDAISEIVGRQKLAILSTWPDEIRSDKAYDYTHPWHYVSLNDDESIYTLENRNPKGDILEALYRFEKQLKDPELTQEQQWQALAFYIHFVGDIHQPLHVGNRYDRGANDVKVKWFGEDSNLHRVWDSQLIDYYGLSYTEYVSFIDIAPESTIAEWVKASYEDWANESKTMRSQAYKLEQNQKGETDMGYKYAYWNRKDMELRLVQAGHRLGAKLNEIFGQ